jgi:archaemetzincin
MIEIYQQDSCDYYELIESALSDSLAQQVSNAGSFGIPEKAFNPLRHQYDAVTIINHIATLNHDPQSMKLGIVDKDIYSHGMNFIFGLADPLSQTAIVSTYRLTGTNKHDRIAKEAIHEIGHLLGLSHCTDASCVMYFSNTIEDTDSKTQTLCETCRSKLES